MSRKSLCVLAMVLILLGAGSTAWGLSDSKVKELLYFSWIPIVLGLIVGAMALLRADRVELSKESARTTAPAAPSSPPKGGGKKLTIAALLIAGALAGLAVLDRSSEMSQVDSIERSTDELVARVESGSYDPERSLQEARSLVNELSYVPGRWTSTRKSHVSSRIHSLESRLISKRDGR